MTYDIDEKEILEIVKKYVDRVDDHNIDTDSCLPAIQDIVGSIEELAMEIEEGKYEKIDDRVGYDD